jgi:hypothetical protein
VPHVWRMPFRLHVRKSPSYPKWCLANARDNVFDPDSVQIKDKAFVFDEAHPQHKETR